MLRITFNYDIGRELFRTSLFLGDNIWNLVQSAGRGILYALLIVHRIKQGTFTLNSTVGCPYDFWLFSFIN